MIKELPGANILPIENPRRLAQDLLLPEVVLRDYPAPLSLDIPKIRKAKRFRPGAVLAATTLSGMDVELEDVPDQEVLVPPGHPAFSKDPEINPGEQYAMGTFEGMRAVPIIRNGQIVAISIPLFEEKISRLERSLQGRLMSDRIDLNRFREMILITAAANAKSVTVGSDGLPSMAYIRPSVNAGDGPLGVKVTPNHIVRGKIVAFEWRDYSDTEKAFSQGLSVAVSPHFQRTSPLDGKYESSYGQAGVIATLARDVAGADEALYYSWGVFDKDRFKTVLAQEGESARRYLNEKGVLCDGPGEELVFLAGKTMIVLPPGYGQLGGTSLSYLKGPIAENLGYEVVEGFVTPDDIRKRKVDGALYVGNAITALPLRDFIFYPGLPDGTNNREIVSFPYLSPHAVKLGLQYRDEMMGKIWPPSGSNLHTFIDMRAGNIIRGTLMDAYAPWYL